MSFYFKKFLYRFLRLALSQLNNILFLIYSLKYFFLNCFVFEKGWYRVNRKFIAKNNLSINKHFTETILKIRPTLNLYNFFGSNKTKTEYVLGLHPKMHIKIFPKSGIIKRIFKKPSIDIPYEEKRNLMQKYIPGPKFEVINQNEFHEDLIDGEAFIFSRRYELQFLILLDKFKNLAISHNKYEKIICSNKQLYNISKMYSEMIKDKLDINIETLKYICTTPSLVLSKGSDLAGPNLILKKGDNLFLIDWEPHELKYRVFWSDILNLVIKVDPVGFFSGTYNLFLKDFFFSFERKIDIFKDSNIYNTLAAANSFWNIPALHFAELDKLSEDEFNSIFKELKMRDLKKAVLDTQILCGKYAN